MATDHATPRIQAPQSEPTLSCIIEAAQLAHECLELAADAVDPIALGREPTDAENADFHSADAGHRMMVLALRSWPVKSLTEALTKARALHAVTDAGDDDDAIRANHASLIADVARLIEAGQ